MIGIEPNGKITLVNASYSGLVLDQFLTKDCGILDLLQYVDSVMIDKGLDIEEEILSRRCALTIRPFLGQKLRLSPNESVEHIEISNVRVHVEKAFQ